jgi:peptidoglycan hydrolase-like protein with peptidoglycan-binding domain
LHLKITATHPNKTEDVMSKKMLGFLAAGIAFFMTIPSAAYAATNDDILSRGDNNQNVVELQQALKQKGFFDSEITGYFGDETFDAVLEYQKENGLTPDGKVGPETGESIFGNDYTALIASLADTGNGAAAALLPGDSGDNVTLLQERLMALEYYDYDIITGYYGPVTEESVKKFQSNAGLQVNGIADVDTLAELFSNSAVPYTMSLGDYGSDVQKLQDRLHDLGYFSGGSTGYYGSLTASAVEEFQKQNNLAVDGKAGSKTRNALYSENAVMYPGGEPALSVEASAIQSKTETIDKALELAYSLLGKDYSYGACGPNSFDCSGFIYYILNNSGFAINKMSPSALSNVKDWQKITDIEGLQIGDLVFFKSDSGSNINHMGIYVGGGSFIHASQSMGGVARSTMTNGYYNSNFMFAKRIV